MASPADTAYFSSARVTSLMNAQYDPRLFPVPLIWNQRVKDVDSFDEEITAKHRGSILIADLIMDDAAAVVYSEGKFQFESMAVPNLKMGLAMNQAMMNVLDRLSNMGGMSGDEADIFTNRYNLNLMKVRYGVELRKEVLKLAMLLDGFNYDRLGVKAANVTFGMYPDLKVADADWTNIATTGLSTIMALRQLAKARYNIIYDRATMSTAALRALVKQTEYINQVKNVQLMYTLGAPAPTAPLQSDSLLKTLAERIIAGVGETFTIEIDDRRYESQDNTGLISQNRFHPLNKVLLTSSANDGNDGAYDFANCRVTEAMMVGKVPTLVMGGAPAGGRGPFAYVTPADARMNPPGMITWGVARGAPRKHLDQSSAVIDVGPSLTETFSTTIPNPL